MKIENLTRITGGKLLNSPYVSSIEGITSDIEKIERGNLFIDYEADSTSHEIAVQKGAYAIITPLLPQILDDEIAWITIDDIELSLIKLARFFASTKDLSFILLSRLQYELIKSLQLDFQAKLLGESIQEAILDILHVKEKTLFFVTNDSYIAKIDPLFKQVEPQVEPEKIFPKGLFYTSYIFNETFYADVRLPKFFIPHLCGVQNFLEKESLSYKIDGFNNFPHFHPLFVNQALEKKDFGMSEKALIFERDTTLFKEAVKHIVEEVGSSKLSLLLPKEFFGEFSQEIKMYKYTNEEDYKKLTQESFHYVLIMSDFHTFEATAVTKAQQMSLF